MPACKDPQVIAVHAADVAKPGQLTVTGSATIDVTPDCVDLTLTVSANDLSAGKAAAAVQAKQRALVDALVKLGLQTGDLKLSQMNLYPRWDGINSDDRPQGFQASITIVATTKRFDQIASIMETGANAGATSMTTQFRRSDLAVLKKQVRDQALAAAKEKAAQMAKTLGIETGRIVNVTEAPAGAMWTSPYILTETALTSRGAGVTLGATSQPLTLDVTIGFELVASA
ncbi:MAG TPA: SIMPL domain-containing protein [Kofleriaceae bacterium]|nr:SIMPL domain-containing protein [Kofleriaceae bacterium]